MASLDVTSTNLVFWGNDAWATGLWGGVTGLNDATRGLDDTDGGLDDPRDVLNDAA